MSNQRLIPWLSPCSRLSETVQPYSAPAGDCFLNQVYRRKRGSTSGAEGDFYHPFRTYTIKQTQKQPAEPAIGLIIDRFTRSTIQPLNEV